MSAQKVKIEDKQIEVVKNWPKPTSVYDMQMFIGFANFYQRFIQGFSRIATLLTSMLKTTRSLKVLAPKLFRASDNKIVEVGSKADKTVRNLSKFKGSKNNKSENLTRIPNIRATREFTFLTSGAKEAFNYLRQVFIKAVILQNLDLESSIQIETNASSYAIGRVLSQLSLN